MKCKNFKRAIAMLLVCAITTGLMVVPVWAHEINANTTIRWSITVARPPTTSGRICVLRPQATATATTLWRADVNYAVGHAWTTHGGGNVRAEFNHSSPNLAVESLANVPILFPQNTLGFAAPLAGGTWVASISNPNPRPGNFRVNYAVVYSFPRYAIQSQSIRNTVAVHEVGHVLGLGHPTSTTTISVMQAAISNSGIRELPQTHDRDDLRSFYG